VPGGYSGRGAVEDQPSFDAIGEIIEMQHGAEAIAEARRFVTVRRRRAPL
jgi:hypothetical protein